MKNNKSIKGFKSLQCLILIKTIINYIIMYIHILNEVNFIDFIYTFVPTYNRCKHC